MLRKPTSRMSLLRSSAVPQCAGTVGLDVAWSLVVDVLTTFDTNVKGIVEGTARLALLNDAVDTEGVPAGGSKELELVARVVLLGNTVCTETVLLVGEESKLLELVAKMVLLVDNVVSIGVEDAMEGDVTSVLFTAVVVIVAVLLRSFVDAEDATLTVVIAEVVLANVEFRTGKVVDSNGIEDGDVTVVMTRLELTGDVTLGVVEILVPLAVGGIGNTEGVGELVTLVVEEGATVVRTTRLVLEEATPEVVGELLPVAEVKVVVRVRVMMTGGALAVPLRTIVLELGTPGATTDVLLRGVLLGTFGTEFVGRATVVFATLEISVAVGATW